ncbi:fibronectin type III-like domain-contianing protein [Streptomyces sp. KL109B]
MALDRRAFSWWDERSGDWRIRPGRRDIRVARGSTACWSRGSRRVPGDARHVPHGRGSLLGAEPQ